MSDTRERELNSVVEILKSRELFDEVVQAIGARAVVEQDLSLIKTSSEHPADSSTNKWLHGAIDKLQTTLSADIALNSNVITVSCKSRSVELARRILEAYVQSCKEHHTRLHRTSGSYEFFETQCEKVKQQLAQAEAELRDAKNQVGVSSIAGEKKLLDERLTALQRELIDKRTTLAASSAKVAALQEQHPEIDLEALENTTSAPSQEITSMRTELFKLEIEERELIAKLSSLHPKVIAIRNQVSEARALYERRTLFAEKATTLSLKAKRAELERQRAETKDKLLRLNESEIRIKSLSQRVTALTNNYQTYEERREQARVDGAMAHQQISDVNLAQAPTFNPKPVSPKRSMSLVLGFLAAAFAAFAITMATEFFDDSFQVLEQVEKHLQLSVILSIPYSSTEALSKT